MNKKLIIGGIVLATIALAPVGVKDSIDKSIDLKKNELENIGLLLSIDSSKGYLKSTRNFTLRVEDEVKFKEYFKNALLKEYPSYEFILREFEENEAKKFDEFLKGIVFKGTIKNSNINLSSDIKVYTYLNSLSDEIMNDIKNDEEMSKVILPLFEKEALAFNMKFDNKSKLKTFALKDIDKTIKSKAKNGQMQETIFQIKGNSIVNDSTEKLLIANVKFDKINMAMKADEEAAFTINDLKYNINYENQFINNGKMQLNSINLNVGNNNGLNLGKTDLVASATLDSKGVYSADSKISTEKFNFSDEQKKISFDNLDMNFNLDGIDYKKLQELNKAYLDFEEFNIKSMNLSEEERFIAMQKVMPALLKKATGLLNEGLSLNIDAKLLGLINDNLNLKDMMLNIDAKLDKNDLNMGTLNQFAFLSLLNVNGKLQMLEEDFINLTKVINPNFGQIATMYAKRDNGKVVFDIDLKKGKLKVNDQNVN